MRNVILAGDVLNRLKDVPDGIVQTVVTSPPYYGLRSYDEDAVRIDERLPDEVREYVKSELSKRGINAVR